MIAINLSSFNALCSKKIKFEQKIISNLKGRTLEESEIVDMCHACAGIIAGTEKYSKEVLGKLNNLKVISRCGAGIDNIDFDAAKELGIKIYNTPDAPTQPVAELTLGLILDMLRRISSHDRDLRRGIWQKNMGNLLQGKRVGFIGFGRIGQRLAKLMEPFEVEIAYTSANGKKVGIEAEFMTLHELLGWSDIVTLHLPKQPDPVIGADEIAMMRPGSWLVNAARGGLVDEQTLLTALESGHLAGAALDVFAQEPYDGPLTKLHNIVLTSHVGSYAQEARIKMEMEAVDNLLKGLAEL